MGVCPVDFGFDEEPQVLPSSRWFVMHPVRKVTPIEQLWNRLHGIYLDKWKRMFGGEIEMENWRESMVEQLELHRIAPLEVQFGLDNCPKMYPVYPPTVGEFIGACRPPLDAQKSFYEAVEGMAARDMGLEFTWSHPAIYWAAVTVGFELRVSPYDRVAARWSSVLRDVHARGQWMEIKPPSKQLPWVAQPSQAGRDAAGQIRDMSIDMSDSLAWARKLVAKDASGEQVGFYALKEAKKALGLN